MHNKIMKVKHSFLLPLDKALAPGLVSFFGGAGIVWPPKIRRF